MYIAFLMIIFTSCSQEKSKEVGTPTKVETPTEADPETDSVSKSSLSSHFVSAGCSSSSCHGPSGESGSNTLKIIHGPDGNPVTNLKKSTNNLAYWRQWIRVDAKSPMPTFNANQYPDSALEADYTYLTGRTE